MVETSQLNRARAEALRRIDRTERTYKLAFFTALGLEVVFLVTFIYLADWNNRLHMLLFISTVASYSIVLMGLVALAAYMKRHTALVLQSMDVMFKPKD